MHAPAPLIVPILHMNGDRAETLLAELSHAYQTLGAAILALHEAAPNARNYYLQEGLFEQARRQHQDRIDTLKAVRASLVAEAEAIQDQTHR